MDDRSWTPTGGAALSAPRGAAARPRARRACVIGLRLHCRFSGAARTREEAVQALVAPASRRFAVLTAIGALLCGARAWRSPGRGDREVARPGAASAARWLRLAWLGLGRRRARRGGLVVASSCAAPRGAAGAGGSGRRRAGGRQLRAGPGRRRSRRGGSTWCGSQTAVSSRSPRSARTWAARVPWDEADRQLRLPVPRVALRPARRRSSRRLRRGRSTSSRSASRRAWSRSTRAADPPRSASSPQVTRAVSARPMPVARLADTPWRLVARRAVVLASLSARVPRFAVARAPRAERDPAEAPSSAAQRARAATSARTKPGAARTTTARWPRRATATVRGDFNGARSTGVGDAAALLPRRRKYVIETRGPGRHAAPLRDRVHLRR